MYNLPQKLFAEFIGTMAVVFLSAGAICADESLRAANRGAFGVLGIALAYGAAVAMMTVALGRVSGGHFNLAITIGSWATKRLGTLASIFYCAAQLLGSIAGAYLLAAIIPEAVWRPVALGTPDLAAGITRLPGMAIESALTFIVVFVFCLSASKDERISQGIGGLAVGLAIMANSLLGVPFTGAAMNPARAFGPALVARHWTNQGVFWVGPLFGGLIAAWVHDIIVHREP